MMSIVMRMRSISGSDSLQDVGTRKLINLFGEARAVNQVVFKVAFHED